jgi:hypothetical protein
MARYLGQLELFPLPKPRRVAYQLQLPLMVGYRPMGSLYNPNRGIIYQRRGCDLASLSRTQPRRGPTGLFLRWSFQLVPMSALLA